MKPVSLSRLESKIVRPGFEVHLLPLTRFRGGVSLGRVHRMWNLMISAMEHEATDSDVTQRLLENRAYSHLCGPSRSVTHSALRSFAGRILATPKVWGEAPGLPDYLRGMFRPYKGPFHLIPLAEPPSNFSELAERRNIRWAMEEFGIGDSVARRWFYEAGLVSAGGLKRRPEDFAERAIGKTLGWAVEEYGIGYAIAHRWFEEVGLDFATWESKKRAAPKGWTHFASRETNAELALRFGAGYRTVQRWRIETGIACHAPRKSHVAAAQIVYPFLIHDGGKPEHVLLRKVNAAVPASLDPELRADICQDLMVGILCGDFDPDDLILPAKEVARRVQQMFPTKYGPISLDQLMPGTEDFRLIDTISNEDSLWARI